MRGRRRAIDMAMNPLITGNTLWQRRLYSPDLEVLDAHGANAAFTVQDPIAC
jgi:hypothetical protein